MPATEITVGQNIDLVKRKRFWLRLIWISIAGIVLPPVIGLIGTVIGMKGAFGELATSGSDVGALSNHISTVLVSTAIGLIVSVLAFVLLVISMVRFFTFPKVNS